MTPLAVPGLRAVVFDLDGTLVDSMPLVMRAFAHALAPFRPELSEGDLFLRLGGPPERTFMELIGNEAGAGEAMRRLEAFGFANSHLVKPFAGAKEMLATLHARGLKLAVWTGRDRKTAEDILRTHDLGDFFGEIVCGDDLATHKPHPGGLLEILRRLSVSADEVFFAGDADADVLGGAEALVRTLFIRHGRKTDPAILARAWRTVETPGEAFQLVLNQAAGGV
ncbi:MAG TPA: HAD family hydrolase [Rariglobus sp.]|nr:HAD family hydrolase [Rariglobus sp.]